MRPKKEEPKMLDFLFSLFKKPFALTHVSLITGHLSDIVGILEEEYMHDANLKNAAIDTVIKMLEAHKTPPEGS